MVEILLAPAASGKTQTAAAALREARGLRMGLVPGSSQVAALLGGLEGVRVPVLTFYGLASRILRRAGQGRPRLLDGQTRLRLTRTLLRELAGAGQLGAYAAVALKPGFVSAAAELLADLGAAGIMPDAFAAAARTPHDADMSALYSAYIERQASSGLADMPRRLILARDALRAQPALLSDLALLAVDGFDQFTLVQLELLAAVAGRVPQTLITLTGSVPARPAHLRFRRTLDELQAALPEARVQVLTSDLDDVVVPTLRYLEQHLFELEPPPPHTLPPAVHVVEAPDRGREVRAALRHALSLVAQGAEPTSIAVLLRETGAYLPLLDETAREYGLPLDLQAGLPLVDSPPISALLALLQLRLDDYPRRGLVAALRSPFLTAGTTEQNSTKKERRRRGTGRPSVIRRPASSIQRPSSRPPATSHQPPAISGTYAALLDQIGRAMGVSGGLDGWRAVLTRLADPAELEKDRAAPRILVEPAQALELLSTIEQLNGWLTPPERLTAASYSAWVRQRLAALNCSRCGERDLAALQRMRQLLGEIERADRRADGSEQASDDLLADLTGTIEKAHYLARNPDGVAIIPMLAARGLQFEHVLILGMSEGQIPQPLAEPAIYARAGRRRLFERGVALPSPDPADERTIFYEAAARARLSLTLSRTRLDEKGNQLPRSPYLSEVLELLPNTPAEQIAAGSVPAWGSAASAHERALALAAERGVSAGHDWRAALVIGELPAWTRALRAATIERWREDSTQPYGIFEGLVTETAAEERVAAKLGLSHRWSATEINDYQICAFRFAAAHLLRLEPIDEGADASLDRAVRGAIEHAILAEAGILWRGALLTPGPESRDTALSMLDAAAQKVLEEAPARLEIQPSAIWPWEREAIHRRMRNAVERLWDDESDWAAFSPYVFELRFGGAAGLPAVPLGTSAGMVMLQGRIDRIDRREDGALALIDYKAGGAHSMRASLSGDDVQLAIYTLAAEHMGAPEARVDRAAFVHIGHGRHEGTLEGEQIGQAVTAATDRIGYVAANARSGDFRVRPRECPSFCAFEVICRKNLAKRT